MESYGRSFFGTITSRLSRLLQLDGRIPLELSPNVTPVVIVGDGTQPGMNDRSGKRFIVRVQVNAQTFAVRSNAGEAGVIIDSVLLRTGGIISVLDLAYISTAQSTGYGYGAAGIVLDSQSGIEAPPVQSGAGAAFGARNVIFQWNALAVNTQLPQIALGFYLAPGAQFAITTDAAANTEGFISGRLF